MILLLLFNFFLSLSSEFILHNLVKLGTYEAVEEALKKDAIKKRVNSYYKGETPLTLAVKRKDPKIVSLLLFQGADKEFPNQKFKKPIRIALELSSRASAKLNSKDRSLILEVIDILDPTQGEPVCAYIKDPGAKYGYSIKFFRRCYLKRNSSTYNVMDLTEAFNFFRTKMSFKEFNNLLLDDSGIIFKHRLSRRQVIQLLSLEGIVLSSMKWEDIEELSRDYIASSKFAKIANHYLDNLKV